MRFVFASASLALVLGCGGSSSDSPASETGTDGAVHDTALPGDGTALDVSLDTSAPPFDGGPDVKPGCPGYEPSDGSACTSPGVSCDTPSECGTVTATCSGGSWHVVRPKCASEYCPDRYPPTSPCATPDQICRYWPEVDAASISCAEFKCTGGAWVDTHTTTCSAPRETCKGGTACTSPFGCALGHCNTYCMCGADGHLWCSAHPC